MKAVKSVMRLQVRSADRGFTFLEIILVVAIIGILAGLVGPRLVGRAKQAKIGATKAEMANIKTTLQLYEQEMDTFPSTSEGLDALVHKPSNAPDTWRKQMDSTPRDGWGETFTYRHPSDHGLDFDLTSKGPDRVEGTEDDINNWDDVEKGKF